MAANDNVTVRIVGDASAVAPAVEQAGGSIAGLEPLLAALNSQIAALTAQMREGFASGAAGAKKLAAGLEEAKIASHGAAGGFQGMIGKIHESAESVRTFQMRAKEFAEVYVAMFAVERVAEFINHMGEAAEKVVHLGQQFGMTTGEVQKLQGVAAATGIPVEALTKGMGFLDRNLANAQAGSKTLKATMDQVGVSFNDGRSQMEKLAVVADKFKNMDDGPKKVALAMQLFGRSGKELIPILDLGSKGIEQLNQKLDEYGVRNDDAVAKGAALAESVNETKLGFMGIQNVLTSALAPVFKVLVDDLNSMIAAFVESYREGGIVADLFAAIGVAIQEVVAVVEALAEIFSAVWQVISEVVGDIAEAIFDCFGVKTPSYIDYAKVALNEFKDILTIVKDAVIISLEIISGAFRVSMQIVITFGKVAWDAMHLNWGAIQNDWSAGMAKVDQIVAQEAQRIKAHAAEMGAAIAAAMKGEALPSKKGGGLEMPKAGGNFDYQPSDGGGKKKKAGMSLPERLEAELEARKTAWAMEQDAQGTFQQYSLQSEADYWAAALRRTDLSTKDKLAIEKKYLAARSALKKDEIDKQLDGYSQEIEAAGANWDAKLAILRQEQAYLERMYGAESREGRQAADAVVRAEREKARQILEIQAEIAKGKEDAALAGVDAEEASAEFAVEMGRRSQAQLIQQERQFENERYAIRRQALLANLRLAELDPNTSPQKLRQIYNQVEDLDRQHQAKLTQIEQAAVAQRNRRWEQGNEVISSGFAKILTGEMGLRDGLISIWQGLVGVVQQVLQQILQQWITSLLIRMGLEKTTAASGIMGEAAKAGAGGTASMAAAPFPINMTAPAFGASMFAAAAAYQGAMAVPGFDVGAWNLSKDQLAFVHSGEMIIPAAMAGSLRDMFAAGGGGGGGAQSSRAGDRGGGQSSRGGDLNVHYAPTINHQDSSLKDSLRRDAREMRRWFGRQVRNGAIPMPVS